MIRCRTEGAAPNGDADLIVWNDDGVWSDPVPLDNGTGTTTLVGLFTDVDGDQQQDVFVPGDLGPGSAMWLNDGGEFTEVGDERGANLLMAAMGVDSADLNGDGLLDYCMTDVGPPRCIQSHTSGVYVEPGLSLGLTPADWVEQAGTVGWSFDFADLDADGHLDAVQSSGPFPDEGVENQIDFFDWPDLMWRGNPDGSFTDVTADVAIGSVDNHVGSVTADFDGDGFLDVVMAGPIHTPELYMNTCGDGGWLMVELVGPRGNSEGIGAQIDVVATGYKQTREVQSLRGLSQSPSRIHYGLGDRDSVDAVRVRWPDGTTSLFEDIPTRRMITITHPSRLE